MNDDFKTYGDAIKFCDKYEAPISGHKSFFVFRIAEALLRAYKDGADNKALNSERAKSS